VTLLRRLLKVQAALWALTAAALGLAPRIVLEDLFSQPPLPEYAWIRAAAVMGIVLALLMVLVAQRIEELWWWSWAFALLEVGTASVFAINALFGLPAGAAAWPWWTIAVVNAAIGAGLLVGMGTAGQQKPFA
jgi:hypothetical protein